MEGPSENEKFPAEKEFDLRSFFRYYFRYWPIFLIVLVISLSAAYFYNWYITPIYRTSAKVLIQDEGNKQGQKELLEELNLNDDRRNIKNEIEVLRSRKLALRVIDQLEFRTSYFLVGDIKVSEQYKRSPIRVEHDTLHFFSYVEDFQVRILGPERYRLSYSTEKGENYQERFRFGEQVDNRIGKFRILKREEAFEEELYQDPSYQKRNYKLRFHPRENIADRYRHKLEIALARPGSSILQLTLEDPVPQKAADFLNTLTDAYLEHNVRLKNRLASNTDRFIEERLDVIAEDLERIESQREQFKVKNKITDIETEGKMILEEIEELDRKIGLVESKISTIEHIQENLEGEAEDRISPSTLDIEDPLLGRLIQKLHELEQKKTDLSFRVKGENPQKEPLEREIRETKEALRKNLRNIHGALTAKKQKFEGRLSEKQERLKNIPRTQRELVQIERKYRIKEKLYTYLLEKKAETRISLNSSVSNNRIIEKARPTRARVRPVPSRNYSIAFILGLVIPVFVIYLREKIDDRIMSIPTIERSTSIPVIGVIGYHKAQEGTTAVLQDPQAGVTEAFRSLRTKLESSFKDPKKDQEGRAILISSSVGNEGKTFTSINLASIVAVSGKKTILLGADLRKPQLSKNFGISNEKGISTYLRDPDEKLEDTIHPSGVHSELDILPSGPTPPDPAEGLLSERMEEMMAQLKQAYERIVIDTPPIGLVTDGIVLTRYSDANLLVVRQAVTRKPNIVQLNEIHQKHELRDFGIVFNAVKANKGGYGYGYGHGYGHAYGYGYGYYREDKQKKKGLFSFFRKDA